MTNTSKTVGIAAATLLGIGVGVFLVSGFTSRSRGWTRNKMVSKSFNIPFVRPEFANLDEQIAKFMATDPNELTDEELELTFR